jgi:hypothetical protein
MSRQRQLFVRSYWTAKTPGRWPSSIDSCSASSTARATNRLLTGRPDTNGQEWLVLCDANGFRQLAFQQVAHLPEPTWPEGPRPQMLHLDTTVPTNEELYVQHQRALDLGARLLFDRSDDPEEPLIVYADPAGHPFCIFVAAD